MRSVSLDAVKHNYMHVHGVCHSSVGGQGHLHVNSYAYLPVPLLTNSFHLVSAERLVCHTCMGFWILVWVIKM